MDRNRIEGVFHEVKGAVKDALGRVTGQRDIQAEGRAENVGGKTQGAWGNLKDSVRITLKH